MNKFERIQLVRALGLNTEESILIASESHWRRYSSFLRRFSRYSVRTFHSGEPAASGTPHLPIVEREFLNDRYAELLRQSLSLIVAAPIDPADAELSGCLLHQDGEILAEVAVGPGTVRRVTHKGQVDVCARSERPGKTTGDYRIDEAIAEARGVLAAIAERLPSLNLNGLLFEFSWYRTPVGVHKEPLIFWEISGTKRQEEALRIIVSSS